MNKKKKDWNWWKQGVIYHIYVLSFFDSNNDGKGDLQGIIKKLDYLEKLGINAIWLSPVFKSPMIDYGYDVSDYYSIEPVFGNLNDFRKLLQEAHDRNIRIILDIVLNHTSDQHPWFIESSADINSSKRDWYIWKTASGKRKPNNWKTAIGGSCWEYHQGSQQYYLHSFLKEQPDLNWRNKEVQHEMFNMLRYWLEMGVDGFRFDVINFIVKDKKMRNNPLLYWLSASSKIRTRNQKASYKIVSKIRKLVDEYPERMIVGEIYMLPPGNATLAASYLASGNDALHLAFDFSIFFVPWNARRYFKTLEKWQNSIPAEGWPSMVFSNHDLLRSFNRFGIGRNPKQKARLLGLLLLTMRGTPFIYYGEEIGMKNGHIQKSKLKDPIGKKFWPFYKSRDHARTPMQWKKSPYAGFSKEEPWLPVNKDYQKVNVAIQSSDPDSLLNLYRQLIHLRNLYPALSIGSWIPINKGENGVISFLRKLEKEQFIILLNFTSSKKTFKWKFNGSVHLILSTLFIPDTLLNSNSYVLQPYEGLILKLNQAKKKDIQYPVVEFLQEL